MVSLYYTSLYWSWTGCNCYSGPTWSSLEWSRSCCLKIGVKDWTGLDFKTLDGAVEQQDKSSRLQWGME